MRKLIPALLVVAFAVAWFVPRRAESVGGSFVFPLSISGKAYQPDVTLNPGVGVKPGKVTDKILSQVLQGTLPDFAAQFLDLDPGGQFFLYFDGRNPTDGTGTIRVATNSNGTNTTTLNAAITNDGFFWASGKYQLPGLAEQADLFATGKVKFAKGTYAPTKITGVLHFVAFGIGETFTVKFKTKGGPLL